jgi:hypothetical protein
MWKKPIGQLLNIRRENDSLDCFLILLNLRQLVAFDPRPSQGAMTVQAAV